MKYINFFLFLCFSFLFVGCGKSPQPAELLLKKETKAQALGKVYLNGNDYVGTYPVSQVMVPQHTEYINIYSHGYGLSVGGEESALCCRGLFTGILSKPNSPCQSYFYDYSPKSIIMDSLINVAAVIRYYGLANVTCGGLFVSYKLNVEKYNNFLKKHSLEAYRKEFKEKSQQAYIDKKKTQIQENSKKTKNKNLKDFYIVLDATESMNQKDMDGKVKFVQAKQSVYDLVYKLDNKKINTSLIVCTDKCEIYVYPTNNFLYINEALELITTKGNVNINDAFRLFKPKHKDTLFLLMNDKNIDLSYLDKFKKAKSNLYAVNYSANKNLQKVFDKYNFKYYNSNNKISLNDDLLLILKKTDFAKKSWESGDYVFRVNFDYDDTKIKSEFQKDLDEFAIYLKSNFYSVLLQGHTDSSGDKQYNKKLSLKRAQAIKNALIEAGVSKKRLFVAGYGQSMPLVPNSSKANMYQNRRVEAKIGQDGYYDIDFVNSANFKNVKNLKGISKEALVGYFLITDKNRDFNQYHAVFVLYPSNQIYYNEFIDNKLLESASNIAYWEYDPESKVFLFDATYKNLYPNSGIVEGKIHGNTNIFDMNGKWNTGAQANTKFKRITKREFLCIKSGYLDCF